MRKRYIQDPATLKLVPAEEFYARQEINAPMVMPDIQPYRSMIDGTMITSRSEHRSHLRQHGCVEVGNELKTLYSQVKRPTPPPGLKDTLIRVADKLR